MYSMLGIVCTVHWVSKGISKNASWLVYFHFFSLGGHSCKQYDIQCIDITGTNTILIIVSK